MAIPKKMQAYYDEIAGYIVPFCDEHLNDEYRDLCLHALEKLCRKRPSPVTSGRPYTWAAGIVYAIGQNNFIFDKHQAINMTADEIARPFGVAKTTASSKAAQIRKMLKIDHYSAEWTLPSDLERNPLIWWVTIDGLPYDARALPLDWQLACFERGLIPYVPALQSDQSQSNEASES